MAATLSRKLNLVVPVKRATGTLYVHSTPVGRDVFDRFFRVVSKAFAEINAGGLGVVAGPRVAHRILKAVAQESGTWAPAPGSGDDPGEFVQAGLMGEIRRLSNLVMGGEVIPLEEAASRGLLDEDELDEVEGTICFFTVASLMHMKADLPGILALLNRYWEAVSTSLGPMEYVRSLPTPTAGETTGGTATP